MLKTEIRAAIAAHRIWAVRLREAAETQISDYTPEGVRTDSRCVFGKFLMQRVPPAERDSPHFFNCKRLHAEFHVAAAKVLELALAGRRAEAEQALADHGDFGRLSGSLTEAMIRWEESSQPAPAIGSHGAHRSR